MTASLDPCACKRGFFTLRDCENAASGTCDVCRRRVCDAHRAPRVQAVVCVECAARQAEDEAVPPLPGSAGGPAPGATAGPEIVGAADAAASTARFRRRYYDRHGYQPMWWGTHDSSWAGDGFRWYDDGTDDDGGGFGDS